jgi:hypothetical protein
MDNEEKLELLMIAYLALSAQVATRTGAQVSKESGLRALEHLISNQADQDSKTDISKSDAQ